MHYEWTMKIICSLTTTSYIPWIVIVFFMALVLVLNWFLIIFGLVYQVTLSLAAKAFANSLPLCKETFFSSTMEDHLVLKCVHV